MKKSIMFGGVSAMLLASAALYAAPGVGKMKMDADGNGAVTKAEAMTAADSRFAQMDANSDGRLDQADKAAKVKQHFAKLDADSNGSITEAEFVAAHEARVANRTERAAKRAEGGKRHRMGMGMGRRGHGMQMLKADANGDKAITQAEFRTAAETRFAKADANSDGTISADERAAKRGGKRGMRGQAPAPADAG